MSGLSRNTRACSWRRVAPGAWANTRKHQTPSVGCVQWPGNPAWPWHSNGGRCPMVRIVLCVLCLVALALPASAQWDPAPLPGYMDPFQQQPERENFYDTYMQNLEQERRETIRERERERRQPGEPPGARNQLHVRPRPPQQVPVGHARKAGRTPRSYGPYGDGASRRRDVPRGGVWSLLARRASRCGCCSLGEAKGEQT